MIYKVLDTVEIVTLKHNLRADLPGTAKIFYVIRNLVKGILSGFEIVVDKWPEWTCIILRPDDEVPTYFQDTYICHAKSQSALKYFIKRPGVVDWTKPAIFTGVSRDLVPVLQDMCKKNAADLSTVEARFMYAWTKQTPPLVPKVPKGLRLSTLQPEHASVMREDWEGKSVTHLHDIETYFKDVIERFDSSCLLDENNELVAYLCMQYNGAMAMLYARPEHRNKGYCQIILSDLTRKLITKGEIAYGFIPTQDTSLINICREIGFEWVPQGNMVWVRYASFKACGANNWSQENKAGSVAVPSETNKFVINAIPLATHNWTNEGL